MLLNALQNQFLIRFPKSFFYTEIHDKWTPVIKRLKLPYESLEDFMNAAVQSLYKSNLNNNLELLTAPVRN